MNYIHLTIEERACISKFKEMGLSLREFYPKQMDLSKTDEKEVQNVLKLLNNRPRKCINYKTPQELFNEYLCECCT